MTMSPGEFIQNFYGNSGGEDSNKHQIDEALLGVLLLLVSYVLFGAFAEHKKIQFIHETGFGIILGVIVGAIFVFADQDFYYDSMTFNPNFFMLFILPPIIFAGGYNLKKKRFFQNFFYIALFGLGGTLINFGIVAGLTYLINSVGLIRRYSNIHDSLTLTTGEVMIYSATICATDSVAALAMIKPDKYPKLFSVIFGEGMVNDAVSIILFQAVSKLFPFDSASEAFKWYTPFQLIGDFLLNAVGAIGFGLSFGIIATLVLKWCRFLSHNVVHETCIIFFFGYMAYMCAELLEWSGVIAILVAGISMSHYLYYNLSPQGKVTAGVTYNFIAVFAEAFLYVYLGISVWENKTPDGESSANIAWSWTFFVLELFIVFIARSTSVFLSSGIAVLIKGKDRFRLNVYELGMITYAGVIRGAIAFALIQSLPNPIDPGDFAYDQKENLQVIKSTTLFIVVFTTIILGGTMPLFIAWSMKRMSKMDGTQASNLRKTVSDQEEPSRADAAQPLLEGGETEEQKEYKSGTQKGFKNIDERYLKRWFIYDYENRKEVIKMEKRQKKLKEENPEAYLRESFQIEAAAEDRRTASLVNDDIPRTIEFEPKNKSQTRINETEEARSLNADTDDVEQSQIIQQQQLSLEQSKNRFTQEQQQQ